MRETSYLFFGFAAEYVLNPLYRHMSQLGYDCIEMDLFFAKDVKGTLKSLKDKRIVFINCAHLFFDQMNFSTSYQHDEEIISPLEIIDYLKPIKSVYIPHDLSQLFHEQERPWLDIFDWLLIPRPKPSYLYAHSRVINVGWIKRSQAVNPVSESIQRSVGFAFSEYEFHRRLGPEKTYELWEPILNQGITVKFPHWKDTTLFEDYFKSKSVNIFPSTSSLSDFIDMHGIILSNGGSSVNAEAAFSGRKTINILFNDFNEKNQKQTLGFLPNIEYLSIDNCSQFIQSVYAGNRYFEVLTPPIMQPFDFNQVVPLLTE